MLIEIDPLPMRGLLVMVSPSWREVSPAEQLYWSPRLVPPCGGGVSSPKLAYYFFLGRKTSYSRRQASEGHQGAHEGGARPPPSWEGCPPGESLPLIIFYIFWGCLPCSFRTFGDVQNRSLIFAPFPAQNSSCRHSPSSCNPCKIRENRHKYCDISCSNSP